MGNPGKRFCVKENAKSKRFMTQNTQEIWDRIKRPNLRIGIKEDAENIFNKITEEARKRKC